MLKIVNYQCEICNVIYDSEKEAKECESKPLSETPYVFELTNGDYIWIPMYDILKPELPHGLILLHEGEPAKVSGDSLKKGVVIWRSSRYGEWGGFEFEEVIAVRHHSVIKHKGFCVVSKDYDEEDVITYN
ncbi:hypothetical protein N9043_00925 [bacterium]|nr:hypothetical protein [bacterium]